MSLLQNLPHRCTIRRRNQVGGSLGGTKTSFTNEQTNVPCWDQNASHVEISDFEKRGMLINHKVYFQTDPSVSERHQILITERNGAAVSSPVALDVKSEAVPDASAGLGAVYKVMADLKTGRDD